MNNLKSRFLKVALSVFVCFLLFVLGALSFWFYQEKITTKASPSPEALISPQPYIISSPVSTSSSEPQVSLLPIIEKTDLEMITEAFATKYSKPVSQVNASISEQSNPYAQGSVSFTGEMGGGWFLAYKQSASKWIIVQDGNGTISCEAIDPYSFPTSMVPECWSESTGTLETR